MPGRPGAASGVPVLLADPQQPPAFALGSFGQPGLTLSTPELSSRLHPLTPLSPSAPGRQAAPLSPPRETKQKESTKLTRPPPPAPPACLPTLPCLRSHTGPVSRSGESIPFRRLFDSSILTRRWVGPSSTRRCLGRAAAGLEGAAALRG